MKKLFRPLVLGGILLLAVGLAPVMDTKESDNCQPLQLYYCQCMLF